MQRCLRLAWTERYRSPIIPRTPTAGTTGGKGRGEGQEAVRKYTFLVVHAVLYYGRYIMDLAAKASRIVRG